MNAQESIAPPKIKFLTLNTWGLKWVSKSRKQRLEAIARRLAGDASLDLIPIPGLSSTEGDTDTEGNTGTEDYDVVALQEVWCKEDWDYLVAKCSPRYPYCRAFYSGILTGPGLAILSKIPIESSFLYRFPINGRPTAVLRGDWYVGKSVAIVKLKPLTPQSPPIVIMNSHMHAPYALTGDDAYECHRSCQAWDFTKIANLYRAAGHAIIIVGDLNSRPGSLPHNLLTQETGLVDSWEQLRGESNLRQIAKLAPLDQIKRGGTTCDSTLNTWRAHRNPNEACRLDYALIDPSKLKTLDAGVRFTEQIATVGSYSDHFAYYCQLSVLPITNNLPTTQDRDLLLARYSNYQDLLVCIDEYTRGARRQMNCRGIHFIGSVLFLIGALVATTFTAGRATWSSVFWVLSAILVAVTGLLAGQLFLFFGRSELRALREVAQEVADMQHHLQSVLRHQSPS